VALYLRPELEISSDVLFVHGGTGAPEFAIKAALENYGEYRELRGDGYGHFAVSMFATVHGIHEQEIVRRLPHGSYGVAAATLITPAYAVLPTSDNDPGLDDEMRWLQQCHSDICLPDLSDGRLVTCDPLDSEGLLAACESHLAAHVATLLGLFSRRRKT